MKPKNLYRIITGVSIVIGGIVTLLVIPETPSLGTMLLAGGIAFLVSSIINHRKYGDEQDSDERSRKIAAYGLSWAWMTGVLFMFCLIWLDALGMLRLGTQNALVASILVLALSAVIYEAWLFRKGDVGQ